jgi:two-component system CheB/CheR fusion protein
MPQRRPSPATAVKPRSSARAGAVPASADFSVVAMGASAGGLDAFRRVLDALGPGGGMAFILVQHLDPTHDSLLVELLAAHTPLTVVEAVHGMVVEPEHLYVIPPGAYLAVGDGVLHLSRPHERHGARLPFDFLLYSLAEAYGERAICVVLSGTGADGSRGLASISARGGWIIAQDPDDATFDGMPRSAIATGLVDLVLAADKIPAALIDGRVRAPSKDAELGANSHGDHDLLPAVIELLRVKTGHDFRLYKPGTLRRRIERRMGLQGIESDRMDLYLAALHADRNELDLLTKDLLINITSFFRDPDVFDLLSRETVREVVKTHPPGQPLRIWTAGCSTGEETYSLAMVFREQIAEAKLDIKLQLFASDLDPDAVAIAREGLYPDSIEGQVSPARLARFFVKEDRGYRVLPDLRATVVFTVQDVLSDPPFSRLNMISCRNLLIYLSPEAQARVLALFHFALLPNGLLLLGSAETVGGGSDRFEVVAKAARIYRRIGKSRPGDLNFAVGGLEAFRPAARPEARSLPTRQNVLADLCRRLVMEAYAPAAVLINPRHECLFSLGPTDRYLRVAPGHPTQDLLAMVRPALRTKLRAAIQLAVQNQAPVVVAGGRLDDDEAQPTSFDISVQPVSNDGEDLLLICFINEVKRDRGAVEAGQAGDQARLTELEHELAATKIELQSAIRNLEISGEEQKAINEEALSVNEEFQSTNEELLTSKEELQSLNEELTALNTQLQETLERQRTTSSDLQNVLYSTDVATLFLDVSLNIRFFTPTTKALFNILPGDIGRPLADLHSLAGDSALAEDARVVLKTALPEEREIETQDGLWFTRRILPYRAHDNAVEGVVITFVDITERKRAAKALEGAKLDADLANVAKSRFLAAASHDLRQPLQSLAFLQGLLARAVTGEREKELVGRLEQTVGTMSEMLNILLDINQIEAGVVRPDVLAFPIDTLLGRMRDEFADQAEAKGLTLDVMACRVSVNSDPRLLEQMVRNLISNALKYTPSGRILVGCRRRAGRLSVEVWDTGIGIAEEDQQAIFNEYHQIGNAARERSRGMGLGLSIVQRLGEILGHSVRVRSRPGKGSVFSIEVPIAGAERSPPTRTGGGGGEEGHPHVELHRKGKVLIIEDDPALRDLLVMLLRDEGHRVAVATEGADALDFISRGALRPDVILADYNLPNGMSGLEVIAKIRDRLHERLPAIILTGDISTETLRQASAQDCIQLNKPVKLPQLTSTIQELLPSSRRRPQAPVDGSSRRAADPRRSSSSSTTIVRCVRPCAACLRMMVVRCWTTRPPRRSSPPTIRRGRGVC